MSFAVLFFLAVAIMLVPSAGGALMLPVLTIRLLQWAIATAGVGGLFLWALRRARPRRVADPEFAESVSAAFARFSDTPVRVQVVASDLPPLRMGKGLLLVPAGLKRFLYANELEAYVGYAACFYPDLLPRVGFLAYWVWAAFYLLLILLIYRDSFSAPILAGVGVLLLVPFLFERFRRPTRVAWQVAPRFVQRGGDPRVLLSTLFKIDTESLRAGMRAPSQVKVMQEGLRAVAASAGMAPAEAAAMGAAMGVSPVLLQLR